MKKINLFKIALLLSALAGLALLLLSCNLSGPCAKGHTPITDAALSATCTQTGLTEGSHCSTCSKVLTAQTVVPKAAHTPGEWETVTEASCTQKGSALLSCSACQAILETKLLDTTAHAFGDWSETSAPTCTLNGSKQRTCANCEQVEAEVVLAYGHTPDTPGVVVKPTCEKAGIQHSTCTVCQAIADISPIAATGHAYGSWQEISTATCTAHGVQKRTCTTCGNVETHLDAPIPHTPAPSWVVDATASCASGGARHLDCTVCLLTIEIEEIPALPHNYPDTWTLVQSASCSTVGEQTRICKDCSYIDRQQQPKLPHTPQAWEVVYEPAPFAEGLRKQKCASCHNYVTLEVLPATDPYAYFQYTVNETFGTATVTGYGPLAATDLLIPETLGGYPVTAIGAGAFANATKFTSISFPTTLSSIARGAFEGCSLVSEANGLYSVNGWLISCDGSLSTLTIPTDITGVADGAFLACPVIESITLESGHTAFTLINRCLVATATKTLILATANGSIPQSSAVEAIAPYAFAYHHFSGTLSIPSNIKTIGEGAFLGCTALYTLTLPATLTSLGENAFGECHTLVQVTNLSPISLTANLLPSLKEQEIRTSASTAFSNTLQTSAAGLATYTVGSKVYLLGYTGAQMTLDLTDKGVTDIYDYALFKNGFITTLIIPKTVTSVAPTAFLGCAFTSVTTPLAYIQTIPLIRLQELIITSGTDVPAYALRGCTTLKRLTLPTTLTVMRTGAFADCVNLEYLAVPAPFSNQLPRDNVRDLYINGGTTVPDNAFLQKTALVNVTIGAAVQKLGSSSFRGCSNMETFVFESGSQLKTIGNYTFCSNVKLKAMVIPSTVTEIPHQFLLGCTSITSFTIPSNVTSIGYEAFRNCTSLTSIIIPAKVTTLHSRPDTKEVGIFDGCTSLESVTFCSSTNITALPSFMFQNCSSLTTMTNLPSSITSIGDKAFYNCEMLTTVRIPSATKSIGRSAFEKCPNLSTVSFANTNGWFRTTSLAASTGVSMTVTNPAQNATYLSTSYYSYYWKRS